MEFTTSLPTTPIYSKWSAIACIAGVINRKAWVYTAGSELYPALYVLLVGKPGSGKSTVIRPVRAAWLTVKELGVLPDVITHKGFLDFMLSISTKPPKEEHAIGVAPIEEFGTFCPEHRVDFLSILNKAYDCPPVLDEFIRSRDPVLVPNPYLTILAGTQPAYLASILPDVAYGMGFISRTIMVYSGNRPKIDIFEEPKDKTKDWTDLMFDLQQIHKLRGKFLWTEEAKGLHREWSNDDFEPLPQTPKLDNYIVRREQTVLKLSLIFSAARSNEMRIEESDWLLAKQTLIEAELAMPEIFHMMSFSSASDRIDAIFSWVLERNAMNGTDLGIPSGDFFSYVERQVGVRDVKMVIEHMIQAGWIKVSGSIDKGVFFVKPGERPSL